MDCHVFRRLCDELAPALMGCRIEKIHRPAKDVTLLLFIVLFLHLHLGLNCTQV